jgi:hypothetical protein
MQSDVIAGALLDVCHGAAHRGRSREACLDWLDGLDEVGECLAPAWSTDQHELLERHCVDVDLALPVTQLVKLEPREAVGVERLGVVEEPADLSPAGLVAAEQLSSSGYSRCGA